MEFVITLDHTPAYMLGVKFVSWKFTNMETAGNLKVTPNKLKGEFVNRQKHWVLYKTKRSNSNINNNRSARTEIPVTKDQGYELRSDIIRC